MGLIIEKHGMGYTVRELTRNSFEVSNILCACSYITEALDFIGEHLSPGRADRERVARKDQPHGIKATVGTLTKATVEIVGEDDAA